MDEIETKAQALEYVINRLKDERLAGLMRSVKDKTEAAILLLEELLAEQAEE